MMNNEWGGNLVLVITEKYGAISAIDTIVVVVIVVKGGAREDGDCNGTLSNRSVPVLFFFKCAQEVCYYCGTQKYLIKQKVEMCCIK